MKIKRLIALALMVAAIVALMSMGVALAGTDGSTGTVAFEGKTSVEFGDSTNQGVPDFDFGTAQITGASHSMPSQLQTNPARRYLKIVDNRGTNAGWNVQVKGSQFKLADNTDTMNGATIELVLAPANIKQYDGVTTTAQAVTPVNNAILPTSDMESSKQVLQRTIQCNSSSADIKVVHADVNKGTGIWWCEPTATLKTVAGTVRVGTSTCTLTWTLGNTPT